jgi:hypothetical protein
MQFQQFRDASRHICLGLSLAIGALAGCASPQAGKQSIALPPALEVTKFSGAVAGEMPPLWEPLVLFKNKPQTEYRLVEQNGKTVLHARAAHASSGLMHSIAIEPSPLLQIRWSWKVGSIVNTIDREHHATEDSPARIILGFDGDKSHLSFSDQILFETARLMTGYDFPYATLMYIWDQEHPVGSVLTSRRSERIKMIVVANSADGIGAWREFKRNVVEDFELAFKEKPGTLIGVGVLTDTDNLKETAEAWYGDIHLLPAGPVSADASSN